MEKGLKFCPTPRVVSKTPILEAAGKFHRRLKWAYVKRNSKKYFIEPFTHKSNRVPSDSCVHPLVLETIQKIDADLANLPITREKQNMSNLAYNALKTIKNNPDIIMKPADKGSSVVIMNRADYITEGYRHLNDNKYYERIPTPIYPETAELIADMVTDLKNRGKLSEAQLKYLSPPENIRPRHFYMLPKIHKPLDKWPTSTMPPGRPIISNCSSETDAITEYIDHFLRPISCKHPSYIRDSSDFLNKIKAMRVTDQTIIATLDISNMYTNIDFVSGLDAVKEAFANNPDSTRPDAEVLRLLELSLTRNDFEFNGETFLQKVGTAMGARYAPSLANIFMAKFEREIDRKCYLKPCLYFRFLDDIFIIWNHGEENLKTYLDILNSHHPNIKFTARCELISNDYLDLTIFKGPKFHQTGHLDTKIFFKETDTHSLLNKASFHPRHVFKGILKSQITRFFRNCSQVEDFDTACSTVFAVLRKRGYTRRFLRYAKSEVLREINSGEGTTPPGVLLNTNDVFFSGPCESRFCHLNHFINEVTEVTSFSNKFVYKIGENLDCNATNIIYLITCKECGQNYVGETSRSLRVRAGEHYKDILHFETRPKTSINQHFNENSKCMLQDFQINAIHRCPRLADKTETDKFRKKIEQFFIEKFKSYLPYGINRAFKKFKDTPIIPFVVPYSSSGSQAVQIAKTHFENLQENLPQIFPHNVVASFNRNKNLKDLLISSKLHPIN